VTPLIPLGTPIAVVAPCGAYNPDQLQAGIQVAAKAGHVLVPAPNMLRPHRYLAGTDAHRLGQLRDALSSPDYGAVWVARGGYGLTRILDDLQLEQPPSKPVLGFSDVTALLTAVHSAGGTAVHAPMPHSLPNTNQRSLDHLWALLAGQGHHVLPGHTWATGLAAGQLVGGNLCLLAATCGTRQQLCARGRILIIEEVGEPAYKIDRMLRQMISAGVLDDVAGVGVGQMLDCRVPQGASYTIQDVLMDQLGPLGVPVVGALPIGHGSANHAFVLGSEGQIGPDAITVKPRQNAKRPHV